MLAVLALALIGIIIYSIITVVYRAGKAEVKITYAPFAASVTFNDEPVSNNATNYILPGAYHIKIAYENFTTIEKDVEITLETKELYGYLSAENEAGETYKREHAKEFNAIGALYSEASNKAGKKLREKWPLMSRFPIKEPHYTLSYALPTEDSFYLTIDADVGYWGVAIRGMLDVLSDEELKRYDVVMKKQDNPFLAEIKPATAASITDYMKALYGGVLDGYEFGEVLSNSEYYYGYILKRVGYSSYVYRYVGAKNESGQWYLLGQPTPFVSGEKYSALSGELIRAINKL